ncbi:MAG TPA: 2Fe-2S iron-sulfur cluster-binding protein [Casimicrobiaceae bacterium]|nr:2Fe-2S iron-sulfur cluster-binding protein [Casimicrobiaceae bacterium]
MSPSSKPTTESDIVRVRLYRFDPSVDAAPRYESYEVPCVPRMRVMDVLDYIHEELAVDFGYRWLCGTRKCGTCAINVNGSPKLACWDEAEAEMTIEPLPNMEVIRDLVTSRDGFEASLAKLSPMLVRKEEYAGFPEPLTSTQFAPMEHLRDCLQCLACQSVCPVIAQGGSAFAGPALLVALSELAQDPRDGADRAHIAADVAHVFDCVSCYECERACPAEIPIVGEAIEPLKRIAYRAGEGEGAEHAKAFLDVVKTRGYLNPTVLALKTRGVNADTLRMAMRMIPRGKVDLGQAFLERKPSGAEGIAKTYGSAEELP